MAFGSYQHLYIVLISIIAVSHYFQAALGNTPNSPCGPGRVFRRGGCVCDVGFYANSGSQSNCVPCPEGFTNVRPGSLNCPVCKAGFGGTSCSPCPSDKFSPGGSTAACRPCPVAKLTECAKGSRCDPAEGLVVELWPDGTKCGTGVCKEGFCVAGEGDGCKPGHGGADCAPCPDGFYSPGGSTDECRPCPLPLPAPPFYPTCLKSMRCDPVKGFVIEYHPDGSDCLGGRGVCRETRCVCKPGHGGRDCTACNNWTYSPGGSNENCLSCIKRNPQRSSCIATFGCDPIIGFYTVLKKEGERCGDGRGNCKQGQCMCAAGTGGPKCTRCPQGFWSPGLTMGVRCQECSKSQIFCKRAQLPCDMFPPCDRRTGQPTATCWVPKPDGATCTLDGNKSDISNATAAACGYKCSNGECLPAKWC